MKRVVVGADPGMVNFGIWVGEVTINKKQEIVKIVTLKSFMLRHSVTDFKKLETQSIAFAKEINKLRLDYAPDIVSMERFQSRGGRMGLISECVGFMLGTAHQIFTKGTVNYAEVRLITAASWKNKVNRVFDLKQEYKLYKSLGPHRMDAALIGLSVFDDYQFLDYRNRRQFFIGCGRC